ncbi:MAG: hypothetical protein ACI9DM_000627, partial [Cyclobacteriaceae bacterium]
MIESNFTASSEIKEILIYALLATVMQSSTVVQADKLNRKRNTKKVLMVMSAQKYVRLINEERFKALICISFASKLLVLKTKYNKKNKVNIVTLGCSKNLVDSEVILTQLRGNEITATHEAKEDDANIVIINTCGFIDNAKQESIDTILRYADAKADGEIEKVY